ncbi:MAG: outer membrane lipoprotein-sorting protein, partial [Pseudomonadales bacterium]
DDDGTMIRRLEFKQPKQFDGVLLPSVLEMTPLNKQGHKTVITYESLLFDTSEVSPDDFTLRNLQSRF